MQITGTGTNPEVLITGAGPTGLMMACQLALHKISFRIIDKKEKGTDYSGALIIQARSLEIFQQLGLAQSAIEKGLIADTIQFVFNGEKTYRIPVGHIGRGLTGFPYLLLLEQSKTEQLLINFITDYGYSVERNTELRSFSQDTKSVTSLLKLPNGTEETLKTKFLVAADGGHSLVREQLHIPFKGKTHSASLFVSDCNAGINLPASQICFSFSGAASAGFFPLKDGRWRVDGTIPVELDAKQTLSFDDIKNQFAARLRMKIELNEAQWFSRFHSNPGYASSYRVNRCFLAGDAAHICNPVGAQGMNTGLQDAYNLAWKLAFFIQGKAKTSILDTYSSERSGIAKNIVNVTNKVFRFITSQGFWIRNFRVYFVPVIMPLTLSFIQHQKGIRHFFFRVISEIGIQYRKSSISMQSSLGNFPSYAPKPGDRLPYIQYLEGDTEVSIHEKVKGPGYHLFLLARHKVPGEIVTVAERYKSLITIEVIPFTVKTAFLYKQFGIEISGCYLVRPDLYIAYRCCKPDAGHFEIALAQFLNKN